MLAPATCHEGKRTSARGISAPRSGLILFTHLHLAASETVTRALLERKITAIAYETIQLDDGSLPYWRP
jgi:alanine dehydrogenase